MAEENIYKHSDSIGYLINKRLGFLLRYGMSFLFVLGLVVLILMYFIKVPDTLEGKFILTSSNPPKSLVPKINGRITRKLVDDKTFVKKGQLLFELENLADFKQINELEKQLQKIQLLLDKNLFDSIERIDTNSLTQLGEIQNQYEQFKKANNELYLAVSNRQYKQEKAIISNRLDNLKMTYQNLLKQKKIYEKELKMSQESFEADSILNQQHSITKTEFRSSESARLQRQLSLINLQQSLLSNENSSNDIAQQLLTIERNLEQQKNGFIQSFFGLKAILNDWKSKYLIIAPFTGVASFNRNIYEGLQVQAGEPLLYIAPKGSELVCEMLIPQLNFGKLRKQQRCVVKFDSYNFEEYGVLDAYVFNISDIPQEIKGQEGTQNFYMAQIAFTNGLATSYNKKIQARFGLTGTANIVLDDKSLLEKLFLDKFKSLFVYQ